MTDTAENVTPLLQPTPSLAAALVKAQAQMQHAELDGSNPHFKSKYATLSAVIDAVKGPLTDNGISYLLMPTPQPNGIEITVRFIHESGETMDCGTVFVPADKNNAHGLGSALTYARRYALATACGIASEEDDDANMAAKNQPARRSRGVAQTVVEEMDLDWNMVEDYRSGITAAIHNGDESGLGELLDELGKDNDLKVGVWTKLDSKDRSYIKKRDK